MTGMLLMSGSALASTSTIGFGGVSDSGSSFNQFNVAVDGVTVTVSGWSDTGGANDDLIERAVDFDKNGAGWSMENRDEANGNNSCYYSSYNHSADNYGKNSDGSACSDRDYDFFLVSFSEAVSLTQATYSWLSGGSNRTADQRAARNQVSVVALDVPSLANSAPSKTWASIKSQHTLESDYSQVQNNSGYYSNFAGNTQGQYSSMWLIGALNSVFGGHASWEGNDGMKLSGISFNRNVPAQVPEPSTMVMLLIALVGLTRFGRRRV